LKTLQYLQEEIDLLSQNHPEEDFILNSVWKIDMAFRPNLLELGYLDTVVLAHAKGTGACFCSAQIPDANIHLIGKDIRRMEGENHFLRIAALDAAYANFILEPHVSYTLTGSPSLKAYGRANIVCGEVARLANQLGILSPKVLTIGSVGTIIKELTIRKYQVFGTDLDPTVIAANMSGVIIRDGAEATLELLEVVDIAIVTGMTVATNTFDEILYTSQKSKTALVMFAQTGSNFAPYFRNFGVNTVVSEHYPFYMFPGDSVVDVYHSNT
jgi:hypothetical protein